MGWESAADLLLAESHGEGFAAGRGILRLNKVRPGESLSQQENISKYVERIEKARVSNREYSSVWIGQGECSGTAAGQSTAVMVETRQELRKNQTCMRCKQEELNFIKAPAGPRRSQ
jgi:hypothetical protein